MSLNWIVALLALASTVAFSTSAPSEHERAVLKRRARVFEVADSYVRHEWRASEANVFHGLDSEGVRVDTPDAKAVKGGFKADGSTNVGVPYQWGGFSSLAEFDAGVRAQKYAGHNPIDMEAQASYRAVGVDCSGFVSRCWNLPFKRSTNTLPAICYELSDFAELLPGDIVNHAKHHVMLFEAFADDAKESLRIYESTIPTVHQMTITVAELRKMGYRPLRYKPLDPRWATDAMTFKPVTLTLERGPAESRWTRERSAKDTDRWIDGPDPLRSAKRDEWAAYAARYDHSLRSERRQYTLTFGCAEPLTSAAKLAITTAVGESTEELVEERKFEATSLDSLLALFLETQVVELEKVSTTAESGQLVVGKRSLPVRRLTAEFDARLYVKDGTPLHVNVVCYTCERVPLFGIVEATFELRVGATEKPLVIVHHFELLTARDQ